MWKLKCQKHCSCGALLAIEMLKKCTFLCQNVKNTYKHFSGTSVVEKVQAVVARSTLGSQHVEKVSAPECSGIVSSELCNRVSCSNLWPFCARRVSHNNLWSFRAQEYLLKMGWLFPSFSAKPSVHILLGHFVNQTVWQELAAFLCTRLCGKNLWPFCAQECVLKMRVAFSAK